MDRSPEKIMARLRELASFAFRRNSRARLLGTAGIIFFSVLPGISCDSGGGDAAAPALPEGRQAGPVYRDQDFYATNTGPHDLLRSNISWMEAARPAGDFTLETRVMTGDTAAGAASAGIVFDWDGDRRSYNFEIFPNEDRVKLYDPVKKLYLFDLYLPDAFPPGSWHTLKVERRGAGIRLYLDGEDMTPAAGIRLPQVRGGIAGLKIKDCTAYFADVKYWPANAAPLAGGFDQGAGGWKQQNSAVWSIDAAGGQPVYRGSVLLGRERLMSATVSPQFMAHFDLLAAAGVKKVRIFMPWNDAQSQARDRYFWDYADAYVIAAHDRGIKVLAGLIMAPAWAIPASARGDMAANAVPPADLNDFAVFVSKVVDRYKPSGELAREMGWEDGYGVTGYELGHEFNAGRVKWRGRTVFAGWLGSLDQYLDYLKLGRDALKAACGGCQALNGGVTDNLLPNYPARLDPTGRRQYLWQGVDDLYTAIEARHPGDPGAASRYFDILNIHVYQWFVNTRGGQEPDSYGSYDFPDPRWYRDRLDNVMAVLARHNAADTRVWITEAAYASADNGDPYRGHVDEPTQARALDMVYRETAKYPNVEKVFWWYAYDIGTYTGLIRRDLTVKPSYLMYRTLTGIVPVPPPG